MTTIPDDPRIDTYGQDSGICPACGAQIDSGRCNCTEEQQADDYQGCTCRGENCAC